MAAVRAQWRKLRQEDMTSIELVQQIFDDLQAGAQVQNVGKRISFRQKDAYVSKHNGIQHVYFTATVSQPDPVLGHDVDVDIANAQFGMAIDLENKKASGLLHV